MDNLYKLLTIEASYLIKTLFEKLSNEKKIYLSNIEKITGIPSYVIKLLLQEIYPDEFLQEKIYRYNYTYYSLRNNKKDGSQAYFVFQSYKDKADVKQKYVHTWICSQIAGMTYDEFVGMDFVGHHFDFNKINNAFENLIPMPRNLHIQYHRAVEKFPNEIDLFEFIQEYGTNEYLKFIVVYLGKLRKLQKNNTISMGI